MAVGPAACADLTALREHIGDCRRCPLAAGRNTLVFGSGNPHAKLMFIGEAPGKNEDLTGAPFVGAAGKLLDELLASIGVDRADVFIANLVKCRPPGNRDPETIEIETCSPFLARQIQLIDPVVIATLGRFSTHYVLQTDAPISQVHGRLFRIGGRRVVPIFHPAAALYDGSKRAVLQDDFRKLRAVIERVESGEDRPAGVSSVSAGPLAASAGPLAEESDVELTHTIETRGPEETKRAGALLAALCRAADVIALSGDLGAGKTALVQGLAQGLGVSEHVPSPTFNILLVHRGTLPLYHFDLYRLERPGQLEDIDFYETLEADGVSAIEWADRFPDELPPERLDVSMRSSGESSRVIEFVGHGQRGAELAARWAHEWTLSRGQAS